MSGITRRKWILKSHFDGLPKREDVELVEEELPTLQEGGTVKLKQCVLIMRYFSLN